MSDRPIMDLGAHTTGFVKRQPLDSLSAILDTFRLDVEIINNAQYCGDWAVNTAGQDHVSFHLVTHGSCFAQSDCMPKPVLLQTGDFVLFPQDAPHLLEPRVNCGVSINTVSPVDYDQGLQSNGVGLLCGYFRFAHPASRPLMALLPPVMIKQQQHLPGTSSIPPLLSVIKSEALERDTGNRAAINRLTESLFIMLIREQIHHTQNTSGIIAALSDTRISRALDAIHSAPETHWTIDKLANIGMMSRSNFTQQFKTLMGESPMSYLGKWRMQNAWVWLKEEGASVYDVALRCGYESEASFSKAFKKIIGETPGSIRK